MDKNQLINKVVRDFTSKFGEKSAATLSSAFSPENVRGFVPTGNLTLDWVIGRRGFPLGRITEVAGPSGSGKSSLCAASIGSAQKKGIVCILFDTEHSYSSDWSRIWGVEPSELILIEPQHMQELFDQLKFVVEKINEEQPSVPIFIIVDSISATPSAEEVEEEDSTSGKQRGQHAKIISEGLRKVVNLVWNQNTALVFVSQLKDNPGIMYGTNKHKLGGHAIEFHSGLQIEVRRKGFLKNKDDSAYGQTIEVKTIKNKFVPPFRTRNYNLYFNEGIRLREQALELISDPNLSSSSPVVQKGGWYEFQGSKYREADVVAMLDDSIIEQAYTDLNISMNVEPTRENQTWQMPVLDTSKPKKDKDPVVYIEPKSTPTSDVTVKTTIGLTSFKDVI
jgi:recombination protein RecA